MTKRFYTDKDIEELFQRGVKSLQITDDVVLTDLAYEKARRLDFQLLTDGQDAPPAAPVRPYLSERKPSPFKPKTDPVSSTFPPPPNALTPTLREASLRGSQGERGAALEKRIRDAVAARLGNQVDAKLLDTIIKRTLKVIRLK